MRKIFVFGIDGAPPKLILEWIDDLPNIKKFLRTGMFAEMETVIPPTSIAAWTSMFSGRDPGATGIYNYIARHYPNKKETQFIDSKNIRVPMIWDILGGVGKKNIIMGMISTSPVKEINGIMLSGFLTPALNEYALYPYALKKEVLDVCDGQYLFDVSDSFTYRKFDQDNFIEKVYKVTEKQIELSKHFLKTKEWDFFLYTNMGSDRLHHRFWRYLDKNHINYESHPKYSNVIKYYYKYIDKKIGEMVSLCPQETTFIILSDHGMNRLNGRINLNDWLIEKGYLVFNSKYLKRAEREGPIKFDPKEINWQKTTAFATNAYEALVFINKGALKQDYGLFCKELSQEISTIPGKNGKKLNTQVFKASEAYINGCDENAPDLIVYFDNLFWGTNCDIGNKGFYSMSNLVGADDALHSREGVFVMSGSGIDNRGRIEKINVLDITPTILKLFNLKSLEGMLGKSIEYN